MAGLGACIYTVFVMIILQCIRMPLEEFSLAGQPLCERDWPSRLWRDLVGNLLLGIYHI